MKTLIALTLTLVGALLLAAPFLATALLALFNKRVDFTGDLLSACYWGGGLLLVVGILFTVFAFRSAKPSMRKNDDTKGT